MAGKDCTYRNPLVRDGISQSQRMPEALNPGYAEMDERSLSDLMRFVVRYAEEIQYYGTDNLPSGDWRKFFSGDVTTVIALLVVENPDQFRECVEQVYETVFDDSSPYQDIRKAMKTLFDLIGMLAVKLDDWYGKVPEGFKIREHLHRSITSRLRPELQKCIGYYKTALPGHEHLVDTGYTDDGTYCKGLSANFEEFRSAGLKELWIVENPDGSKEKNWKKFYDSIADNATIYQADDTTIKGRARAGFSSVRRIAEIFINVIQKTQQKTPEFIEETLSGYSAHEPQTGLLITFLKLFRYAQDHMNTLTRRHLDFYYEEVLKLDRRDAVPDRVHLLAELAKHTDSHMVEKGTLFKAGKDAKGNEVMYRSTRDVVLNKARVAALKSVFIDTNEHQNRVYDKPVANSRDGTGTKLEDPSAGWKAFGESQLVSEPGESTTFKTGKEATMQVSDIGLALSSPVLMLEEGIRTITLDIVCSISADFSGLGGPEIFSPQITGPKGWVPLTVDEVTPLANPENYDRPVLRVIVKAGKQDPPVGSYDPKVHMGRYGTSWPVLKLNLAKKAEAYGYEMLKKIKISQVEVSVEVVGMKNLVLQNELGLLDPVKPFQPFGPKPAVGTEFYIGSWEVFSKKLEKISLKLAWHDWPAPQLSDHYNYDEEDSNTNRWASNHDGMEEPVSDYHGDNSDFKIEIDYLDDGTWKQDANPPERIQLFPANFETADEPGTKTVERNFEGGSILDMEPEPGMDSFEQFTVSLKRGFMRLVLKEPTHAFGHALYPDLLTQQVISRNRFMPSKPYTPTLKSIELEYMAAETINRTGFEKRDSRFYHVYPFGEREILNGLDSDDENFWLMPQFSHIDEDRGIIRYRGECYIGISGLQPPQQLSLLIRVAEGSEDPSEDKIVPSWFCLADDGWRLLEQQDIVYDSTNGLLTSGIIRFNLPEEATAQSNQFPGDLFWIKAATPGNPDAVCRLIDVKAQALAAEFADRDNDPAFLSDALKAGTISKMKTKQAEVKKITQPYASEGGKMSEQDTEFYRRVSERLRHKERGVTIWDYERLVLQHFPDVYKAKCINHSTYDYKVSETERMTAEFAPGFVSLVVVPDLLNKNAVEPLKPRLSINMRDKISKFLKQKVNPFLQERLKVVNPLFEQVKVHFEVTLFEDVDKGYYQQQLANDLVAYLSPWAFKEGKDLSFGGKVHKSVILNFIEKRSYVDYITDFSMDHYVNDERYDQDVDEITATTARSVIVSHKSHTINDQVIEVTL